jgi:hypothetical protein
MTLLFANKNEIIGFLTVVIVQLTLLDVIKEYQKANKKILNFSKVNIKHMSDPY